MLKMYILCEAVQLSTNYSFIQSASFWAAFLVVHFFFLLAFIMDNFCGGLDTNASTLVQAGLAVCFTD